MKILNLYRFVFLISIIIGFCSNAFSQSDKVWIFSNTSVDFNYNPPLITGSNLSTGTLEYFGEAAASVSDNNGKLLFYTEGTYVFDRNHQMMQNGNYIPSDTPSTNLSPTGSSAQGSIIVPFLDSPYLFYIFSLFSIEQRTSNTYGNLYYSIVDMRLNNGLGDIVNNQKGILIDTGLTERMTAVVGDQCNIWLLTVGKDHTLRSYEINNSGINTTPVISVLNDLTSVNTYGDQGRTTGKIEVAPNRKKIAISKIGEINYMQKGVVLADFNPVNGVASNSFGILNDVHVYGICFSENSKYLYTNDRPNYWFFYISQVDLEAGTAAQISNSRFIIDTFGYSTTSFKREASGKIYLRTHLNSTKLSVINNPNEQGTLINYVPSIIQLSNNPNTTANSGLPSIVPIFKRDTIINSSKIDICSIKGMQLVPSDTTTGWHYTWSDGSTDIIRSEEIDEGTYWVSYFSAPCIFRVDTFHISLIPPSVYHYTRLLCDSSSYVEHNGRYLNTPGIYTDTLQNDFGCDSIITLELIKIPENSLKLSGFSSDILCLGDTINIEVSGFTIYSWYVNDNQISVSNPFLYKIKDAENEIKVIAHYKLSTSDDYCTDSTFVRIIANPCCDVMIPTAFSPNNDGKNDKFGAHTTHNIRGYVLEIFNRWGQLIFDSRNINYQWDGTFNGLPVDIGVYFYKLSYNCEDGTVKTKKGDITLLR